MIAVWVELDCFFLLLIFSILLSRFAISNTSTCYSSLLCAVLPIQINKPGLTIKLVIGSGLSLWTIVCYWYISCVIV